MRERDRNLERERHLRYKKETKMWKVIVLVLAIVALLLAPGGKLKRPQKGKKRRRKRESDYVSPSGPIPPVGPGL